MDNNNRLNILEESIEDIIHRLQNNNNINKIENDESKKRKKENDDNNDTNKNCYINDNTIESLSSSSLSFNDNNNNNKEEDTCSCIQKTNNMKFTISFRKKEKLTHGNISLLCQKKRMIKQHVSCLNKKRKLNHFQSNDVKKRKQEKKTHLRIILNEKDGKVYNIPLQFIAKTKQSSYLLKTSDDMAVGKICAYYRGQDEQDARENNNYLCSCRNGSNCTLIHLDPKYYHGIRSGLI